MHRRDGQILVWNPAAERIFGLTAQEMQQRLRQDSRWQTIHEDGSPFHALSQAKTIEPYHTQRLTKDGVIVEASITATALLDEAGKVYAISTMERAVEGEDHD